MTDNEIIKALECCSATEISCKECPYRGILTTCTTLVKKDALELIKRRQEEIDLLKMDNERMTTKVFEMAMKKVLKEKVRAEAIKEFADKLKANLSFGKYITGEQIDNLVKEMGCSE